MWFLFLVTGFFPGPDYIFSSFRPFRRSLLPLLLLLSVLLLDGRSLLSTAPIAIRGYLCSTHTIPTWLGGQTMLSARHFMFVPVGCWRLEAPAAVGRRDPLPPHDTTIRPYNLCNGINLRWWSVGPRGRGWAEEEEVQYNHSEAQVDT